MALGEIAMSKCHRLKSLPILALLGTAVLAGSARAQTVYDNFSAGGGWTYGWEAGAQKFPVPQVDNVLASWRSRFDTNMRGRTINFRLMDIVSGSPGGNVYFETNVVVPLYGVVTIENINVPLVPQGQYAAAWDFLGYNGEGIYFTQDTVPGNMMLWRSDGLGWQDYPQRDLILTATFVPEPTSMLGVVAGLMLMMTRRRRGGA
jgi:hypothetical protein